MHDPLVREIPVNAEAEVCLLGPLVQHPEFIVDVVAIMRPEYFTVVEYRVVYEAIIGLYRADKPIDAVTLCAELTGTGQMSKVGDDYKVSDILLARISSSLENTIYYAEIVRDKYILRELITKCGGFVNDAYSPKANGLELVADISTAMTNMLEQFTDSKSLTTAAEIAPGVAERVIERAEHQKMDGSSVNGLPTGLIEMDEVLYGFEPGEIIILAGRPSLGKSSMALNFAEYLMIEQSVSSVIFSIEMSSESLVERLLASVSGVSGDSMRRGYIEVDGAERVRGAVVRIQDGATLVIDDTPRITPEILRSLGRKYVNKYGSKLIIIDYLQLMSTQGKYHSDNQKYADVSRQIKLLARELNLPIIVLAQLNRAAEIANRRPRNSDLRDSGAIEQDADKIIILWQDPADKKVNNNIISAMVTKHRSGPTGIVRLLFNKSIMKFQTLAKGGELDEGQPDWESNRFPDPVGN